MRKNLFLPLISGLFLCVALLSACGTGENTTNSTTSDNSVAQKTAVSTTSVSKTPAYTTVSKTPAASLPTVVPTHPATSNTTNSNTAADNSKPGACSVTYGCGTGSSNLTPYNKGNGYTINFPGSWVIEADGSNGTIFSTPDKSASFHVFVEDSSTLTNPLRYEFGTLSKDNCHAVPSGLPVTQSNSGFMWNQSQYICDAANTGGQRKEIGVLTAVDTHNGKYYNIDYITSPDGFDTMDQDFFGPMISSFKLQTNLG